MSEYPHKPEVPDHVPRVHQPGNGLSEEAARQLDLAHYQMEQGGLASDEGVVRDPSSETWENIHAADIGTGVQALNKSSTNEQVFFAALVEREKNQDPDIEHEEAYNRAVEKMEMLTGGEEEDKADG